MVHGFRAHGASLGNDPEPEPDPYPDPDPDPRQATPPEMRALRSSIIGLMICRKGKHGLLRVGSGSVSRSGLRSGLVFGLGLGSGML